MGREYPGSNRDRSSRGRDEDDDYSSFDGGYNEPPRTPRSGMTPPTRGSGARSGVGGRSSAPSDPSNASGRRSGVGGGLIRPPLVGVNTNDDGGPRSRPPSGTGRGGPRSDPPSGTGRGGGPRSVPNGGPRNGNGGASRRSRADYDESERDVTPARGPRRSMASMARDVSRSMSRQLSVMMSRVGRTVRQDDSRVSRTPSPAPRRSPIPPEIATEVASRPYRRSRARLITAKWRRGRVRPNPIAIAVGAMSLMLLTVVILVGGGAGMAYAVNYYNAHIGQIQAVAALRYQDNSTMYDRNGNVIDVVKSNDSAYKFYTPLQYINPLVQWATIDTEDRTFYSNPGIDITGTLRALLADVHSGGSATQGGSGITQQLVKIAVLDDASKALQRKINEAIISIGMTETQAYDKNFILEMYLNSISYGDQNTGIEAAARNYFGLTPSYDSNDKEIPANENLDLAQTAILVALPNNPTEYLPIQYTASCTKLPCTIDQWSNPWAPGQTCGTHIDTFGPDWYLDPNNGHEYLVYCRALEVLHNLQQYGTGNSGLHFTNAQFSAAANEVLSILENQQIDHWAGSATNSTSDQTNIDLAPHFVQYVSQILSEDFGIDHLESAGLRIYTTLDLNLQNEVQKDITYYVAKPHTNEWYSPPCYSGGLEAPLSDPCNGNAHNGAAIAIDQYTGDILAMVGSADYNSKDPKVAGAVNVVTADRSMGSATKPIVYATAFQMGWNPGIMLQDQPICFPVGVPNPDKTSKKPFHNPDAQACDGWYAPRDYEANAYSGTFPLRRQLDDSLNIAATETMSFVGMTTDTSANILTMAQRLGVDTLSASQLGPSTVLGTQDIPLIKLTGAYATFANLGKRNPPRSILAITDSTGKVMWSAGKAPNLQAISPQASYMITNVLIDNPARAPDFGLHNPLKLDAPYDTMQIAGKTGTSSGNVGPRDIVTEGYTPYMTLGVWVGNSDSSDLNSGIIGIAGAGYIFHDVMQWSAKHYNWDPNATFQVASGLAMGDFNCNTGLAPYKGSTAADLQCQFVPYVAPTCTLRPPKFPYYCDTDPYNNALQPGFPSWIGKTSGEDRDLYVIGQNWVQS